MLYIITLSYVCIFVCFFFVFFFKQKTAYEMRISDWSSDVCSSDLVWIERSSECWRSSVADWGLVKVHVPAKLHFGEIGRASCRKECVSTCRSRWSPYH